VLKRIRQRAEERDRPIDIDHMTKVYDAFQILADLGYLTALDTSAMPEEQTLNIAYAQVGRELRDQAAAAAVTR
jgi:hypothetical protein